MKVPVAASLTIPSNLTSKVFTLVAVTDAIFFAAGSTTVTVVVAVFFTEPLLTVAVIFAVPSATPVTTPFASTVATAVLSDA